MIGKWLATGLIGVVVANGLSDIGHCSIVEKLGDPFVTVDLNSGWEWLDWSHPETYGRSYDELAARMATPGDFLYGFRFASGSDVLSFTASAGVVVEPREGDAEHVDWAAAINLIQIWGGSDWIGTPANGYAGYGGNFIMRNSGVDSYPPSGYIWAYPLSDYPQQIANMRIWGDTTQTPPSVPVGGCYGYAVLRDMTGDIDPASVPEPSSLAVFLGLGGMGLIAAYRRRKQTA
jgi:hypothetical protein